MKLRSKTSKKTGSTSPNITVPDQWNKLNRKQLLLLCKLFKSNIEITAFRVIILSKLSGLKILQNYEVTETDQYRFLVKHKKDKFYITAALYHEMLKAIEFVNKDPDLTNQLIPNFYSAVGKYYGPEEACYNITYNELIHAQLAFTNYINTKEIKHLDTLVAVLYRKKKARLRKNSPQWDGEIREQFSAYNYKRRARWFRFVPFKIKYAIFIFYQGSLNHMYNEHPLCFKPSTRISSTPKNQNPAKALIDLVPIMTKGDPTKNEALYATPAWDVFDAYEKMREEMETRNKK